MQMEEEIICFLSEFLNIEPDRITNSTLLFDDLGVDGDDAVGLMEEFSKRFNVDLQTFPFGEYFGGEGLPPTFLFHWLIIILKRLLGKSAHEAAGLKPLSVARLVEAAEKKQW